MNNKNIIRQKAFNHLKYLNMLHAKTGLNNKSRLI